MRLRSFVFFAAVVFSTLPLSQTRAQSSLVSHWEKIGPIHFTGLVKQTPTRMVAATDHGYLYSTEDDGVTWQRQEVSDTVDINSIAFADSLHGALVASGNLLLTSDGGATWNGCPQPSPWLTAVGEWGTDTLITGTQGFRESNGQFLFGLLFRSTDRGAHWDTVFIDTGYSNPHKFVTCFGRTFAIGPNMCVVTGDAGAHWAPVTLQTGSIAPQDIDFYNRDTGAIAALEGYYVTTDGGSTWAFTPVFHDERDDNYMTVSFFGPTSFAMFGTPNAYLFTSTDLGQSVSITQMRQASSISHVIRTGDGDWLAVGGGIDQNGNPFGDGGIVLRAELPENAIAPNWTVLHECSFNSGVSLHASNGAVLQCLAGSYPLISTDSGYFWQVTNGQYPEYTGMHFASADTGYIYHGGWLDYTSLETTDSGETWNAMAMSPTSISMPCFGGSDTGFATVSGLVRTTDGGKNWEPDSTLRFSTETSNAGYKVYRTTVVSIDPLSALDAYLLARVEDTLIVQTGKSFSNGEKTRFDLYSTTDGGVSWQKVSNVPSFAAQPGIYFYNSSLGFLTSSGGKIYRTSDGGNSWNMEQVVPALYSFNGIKFLNERIGFLTIDTEAVLSTTDGGVHWSWLPIPTNREEIYNRQDIFIYNNDTIPNRSGMSTQGIFFPDSSTVLVSFARSLIYFVVPPKDTVINGDTIVEIDPSINTPISVADYGFYRGRLNLAAAAVRQPVSTTPDVLNVVLYPDPAQDELHLSIASHSEAKIEILNVLGNVVLRTSEAAGGGPLDVSALPIGTYVLRCSADGRIGTKTFQVVR